MASSLRFMGELLLIDCLICCTIKAFAIFNMNLILNKKWKRFMPCIDDQKRHILSLISPFSHAYFIPVYNITEKCVSGNIYFIALYSFVYIYFRNVSNWDFLNCGWLMECMDMLFWEHYLQFFENQKIYNRYEQII